MLVDAAGLYFRAFYGVPESITAPDGRPINAVRGFLDMTATLIGRRRPTRYVACLDLDWRPAFRVELVPSYKAHRVAVGGGEDVPEPLAAQVPVLLEVLAALGLAAVGAPGFEADDVIATLAHAEPHAAEVVTGDRDLMALASDTVRVLYVGRGVAKLEDLGPIEVEQRYGVPAGRYPDLAALRGDPSDGLPGVAGIGAKTAAALVNRFGSIESILAAAERGDEGFPPGAQRRVVQAQEYLLAAIAVVRGRVDLPLKLDELDCGLPEQPRDAGRLVALSDEYGLDRSVNRVLQAIAQARS